MSNLSTCPPATIVSCCINLSLSELYASLPLPAPPTGTPPGLEGISASDFNPFFQCRDRYDVFSRGPSLAWVALAIPQYRAIQALLAGAVLVGLLGLCWRAFKFGLQDVWLVRRLPGPQGSWWMPNPTTTYFCAFLGFALSAGIAVEAAARQVSVTTAVVATERAARWGFGSVQLLCTALSMSFIYLLSWIQGFALLFSLPQFLPNQSSLSLIPRTHHPFGLHHLRPSVLNLIFVAVPCTLFTITTTGGILNARADALFFRHAGLVIEGLTDLGEEYAQANGTTFAFSDVQLPKLDEHLVMMSAAAVKIQTSIEVAYVPVLVFDAGFLLLYTRVAFTVVSLILRQLRVLRQTSRHFGQLRDSAVFEDSALPSPTSNKRFSRYSTKSTSAKSSRDEQEHAMLVYRLRLALAGVFGLGSIIVVCCLLAVILSLWALLDLPFRLIQPVALATFWVWSLVGIVCVSLMTALSVAASSTSLASTSLMPTHRRPSVPAATSRAEDDDRLTPHYLISVLPRRLSAPTAVDDALFMVQSPVGSPSKGALASPTSSHSVLPLPHLEEDGVGDLSSRSIMDEPPPGQADVEQHFTPSRHFKAAFVPHPETVWQPS